MDDDIHYCLSALVAVESYLNTTAQRLRKAAHVEPLVYVPEATEAQALATLVYCFRQRIEALHQ